MASKITPLYAETRILLNLWALNDASASKSKFVPGKAYASALQALVEGGELAQEKKGRYFVYSLNEAGRSKLATGLLDDAFRFNSSIGPKTTNAMLSWFREKGTTVSVSPSTNSAAADGNGNGGGNGQATQINSYEEFAETALSTYDQLNQDYNLDDLVPIYRIRRELGDRISRHNFNEWLLKVQSDDVVQLTSGDIPNVTAEQLEDSVAIPGGGTRFYVKRL